MKIKLLSFGFFVAVLLWIGKELTAQNPVQIQPTTADPTGQACNSTRMNEKIPDGKIYTCQNGVMGLL